MDSPYSTPPRNGRTKWILLGAVVFIIATCALPILVVRNLASNVSDIFSCSDDAERLRRALLDDPAVTTLAERNPADESVTSGCDPDDDSVWATTSVRFESSDPGGALESSAAILGDGGWRREYDWCLHKVVLGRTVFVGLTIDKSRSSATASVIAVDLASEADLACLEIVEND